MAEAQTTLDEGLLDSQVPVDTTAVDQVNRLTIPQVREILAQATREAPATAPAPSAATPAPPSGGLTLESVQAALESARRDSRAVGEFSSSRPVSRGETSGALLTGTGTGLPGALLTSAGTAGGMRLGVRAGTTVGAVGGPIGMGVGAMVGGTLGFGGGYLMDKLLESRVPPKYLNDRELIPYYQAGRTFGQTVGTAPLIYGIPEVVGGPIANYVSAIGREARRAPRATGAREFTSGAGAGFGTMVAVSYDPNSPLLRFGLETGLGMFNPANLLVSTAQNGTSALSTIKARFGSESARNEQAAAYITEQLKQGGEDPAKLMQRLQRPQIPIGRGMPTLPPGAPSPTSGAKTGSRVLTAIANTLARGNPAFGTQLREQDRNALNALEVLTDGLRSTGDSEAIRVAAAAERQAFQQMLEARQQTAYQDAAEKISRIQVDNRATREQIGDIVLKGAVESVEDGREVERMLWKQAEAESFIVTPGSRGLENATVAPRMVTTQNANRALLDAVTSVSSERWRELPGSNTASAILRRFGIDRNARDLYDQGRMSVEAGLRPSVADEYITVSSIAARDMIRARGELLGLAREAATTSPDAARVYNQMADGILEDLSEISTPAFDRARTYSREFNDFHTRTWTKTLTGSMRTGAARYAPETLVQLAFKSNNDVTAQRMNDVLNSAHFLSLRHGRLLAELGPDHPQVLELAPFAETSNGRAVSVADAQRRWLLLGANKALKPDPSDPMGGVRLNTQELAKFTSENEDYLRKAGLLDDLQNAATAEAAFRTAMDPNSAFNVDINNQAAFANIFLDPKNPGRELDPVLVVTNILRGRSAGSDMRGIAQMARRRGGGAEEGLKSILFDYAATSANMGRNNYSPTAFYDSLFSPLGSEKSSMSLMQIMRNSGLMSQLEINNVKRLLMPQMRIEAASMDPKQLSDLANMPLSPIQRLAVRYAGARVGGALAAGAGSGASIQIPAYAAGALEELVSNQPNMLIKGITMKAMTDSKFLSDLLTMVRPNTQSEGALVRRVGTQLGISGFASGIPATLNLLKYTPPEREDQPLGAFSSPAVPRPQPPAPAARGVGTPAPAGGAPAPAATPGPVGAAAPQQQDSRAMLAQLFPFDATLQAGG